MLTVVAPGTYKIKCVKVGGHTLTGYGQYAFSENEEIDLLAQSTPPTLRAGTHHTAKAMCEDTTYEIAQLIAAGDFIVTEITPPVTTGTLV